MKNSWMKWVTLAAGVIAGSSCSFFPSNQKTKEFVVIDTTTRNILNSYEYETHSGNLVRTVAYDDSGNVRRATEYEYTASGNLSRQVVQTPVAGRIRTSVVSFLTKEEYDDNNRVVKIIQQSDSGETIETFYGYDEKGALRGAVQKTESSVTMMDY